MKSRNENERLEFLLKEIKDEESQFGGSPKNEIIEILIEENLGYIDDEITAIENKYYEYDESHLAAKKEKDEVQKKFSKYRKSLESMQNKDLCKKFIKVENKYINAYSDNILEESDFQFWNKRSGWKVREFMALKFAKDPKSFEIDRIKRLEYIVESIEIERISDEYDDLLSLVKNAITCRDLQPVNMSYDTYELDILIRRKELIKWCNENDILLPKELGESKTKSMLDSELSSLKKEILSLQTKIQEKPLGVLDKKSLLQMVYAMAIKGYGWKPDSKKSPVPKEITTDINLTFKNPITDDTVRKWLKEAKEFKSQFELDES